MNSNRHNDLESLKICVLGQVGSGKSAMTLQFIQHHFPVDFDENIEDTYFKTVEMGGKSYSFHVLDTAIKDDYSPLKDLQYSEADGFIIIFSVDSIESFHSIHNEFNHIIRVRKETPPMVLVGNKIDLELDRQVEPSEGEESAEQLGFIKYFEASAKNNLNVNEPFMLLGQSILNRKQEMRKQLEKLKEINERNESISKSLEKNLNDYINNTSTFTTNTNLEKILPRSGQRRFSQANLDLLEEFRANKNITPTSLRKISMNENVPNSLSNQNSQIKQDKMNSSEESIILLSHKNNSQNELSLNHQKKQSSVDSFSKKQTLSEGRTNFTSYEEGTVEKTSNKCCIIM